MTLGTTYQAEVHDPAIVEGDCCLEQEVCVAAGCALVQMHVTDWAAAQKEDPMLSAVLGWLKAQKKDRFEGTSGRTDLQQRRLADLTKSAEFYNSSRSLVLTLNTQR